MKVTQSDHDKKIEMQEERVKRIQASLEALSIVIAG
jgi:hypothetical protein